LRKGNPLRFASVIGQGGIGSDQSIAHSGVKPGRSVVANGRSDQVKHHFLTIAGLQGAQAVIQITNAA